MKLKRELFEMDSHEIARFEKVVEEEEEIN